MRIAPAEIYLIDAATLSPVDVNASARQNLGYDGAALRGLPATDLIRRSATAAWRRWLQD
ncbi:hypothetical protein [Massilia sp. Se16.2.3]|uniref:hypothetical protein n=1 Tax=Massilia sp. Se16.2.3 TaxID=2709303 RepID=UPI001E35BBD1|nr:hypothetical protein [Massilia sp. Se16.2.3]